VHALATALRTSTSNMCPRLRPPDRLPGPRDGRATRVSDDRPLAEFLASWSCGRRHQCRAGERPRERVRAARLLGHLQRAARLRRPARGESSAALRGRARRRARPLDGEPAHAAQLASWRAIRSPRTCCCAGRDRHHHNYVEHPRWVAENSASARRASRRRPAPGHPPAPPRLRVRDRRAASADVAGEVCGRSSARCARALTWRAAAPLAKRSGVRPSGRSTAHR